MFRRLMPHQRRGLAWACSVPDQRLPLLWDMRLGKTLLTIRWIERMEHLPALVICPLSVIPTWEQELNQEDHNWVDLHDRATRDFINQRGMGPIPWALANFATIVRNPSLLDLPWKCVGVDESDNIRNPAAKITKFLCNRTKHVPAKFILSGYPTPNRLSEIFTQMLFLRGEFLGYDNYWHFRKEMYQKHFCGFGWQPKQGTLEAIRRGVDKRANRLRRRDVNIGSRVIREYRYAQLPSDIATEYKRVETEFAASDGRSTKWKVVVDNWLRQLAGGPHKDQILFELLDGELREEKVVIWFTFQKDLQRIKSLLRKKGRPIAEMHGGVSLPDRRIHMRRFKQPGAVCMLATPASGKYGQDFSDADISIFYSLDYDNANYQQAMNRVIHPLKGGSVLLVHIVTKDTIEEDVVQALQNKMLEGGSIMRPLVDAAAARRLLRSKK